DSRGRVARRGLGPAALAPRGEPRHVGPHATEARRHVAPRVDARQAPVRADADAVEADPEVLHDAQRHLAADRLDLDARRVAIDEERLHAPLPVAREHGEYVGAVGAADPLLLAVEDPRVAVPAR